MWRPEEVSMSTDVTDWQEASEEEKAVIGGILRGFTQLELHVACYWGDVVTKFFPKHEVHAMARAFSCSEAVHAAAYSHLSDTLGLDEFEAFLGDPTARTKIDYFVNQTDPIVSLGVFSGAGEAYHFSRRLLRSCHSTSTDVSKVLVRSFLGPLWMSSSIVMEAVRSSVTWTTKGTLVTIKSDRSWKDLKQSSQMKTTSLSESSMATRYLALIAMIFGTIFAIGQMIG